jgi:hypothetical protein
MMAMSCTEEVPLSSVVPMANILTEAVQARHATVNGESSVCIYPLTLLPPAGVPCDTPRIIHGRVAGGGGRFPGSNAHYTCDGGYSLVGSTTTLCAITGASTTVCHLHDRATCSSSLILLGRRGQENT